MDEIDNWEIQPLIIFSHQKFEHEEIMFYEEQIVILFWIEYWSDRSKINEKWPIIVIVIFLIWESCLFTSLLYRMELECLNGQSITMFLNLHLKNW